MPTRARTSSLARCCALLVVASLCLSRTANADNWGGAFTGKSGIQWTYRVQTDGPKVKIAVRGEREGKKFEASCRDAVLDATGAFEATCAYSGSDVKFRIGARLIGDTSSMSYLTDTGDRTSVQLARDKAPPAKSSPSQSDTALDAIVANPDVKKKMGEFKSRLAWMKTDGTPGADCYDLKENLPTHMPFVATYCRERATGKVVQLDPASGNYVELGSTARPEFDMMGPGTFTCADFLSDIAKSSSNETAYVFWAQGFMSGSNSQLRLAEKPRRNLNSPNASGDGLRAFLRSYCAQHREERLLFVVGGLFNNLPLMTNR